MRSVEVGVVTLKLVVVRPRHSWVGLMRGSVRHSLYSAFSCKSHRLFDIAPLVETEMFFRSKSREVGLWRKCQHSLRYHCVYKGCRALALLTDTTLRQNWLAFSACYPHSM
jgi:hypothetical protein